MKNYGKLINSDNICQKLALRRTYVEPFIGATRMINEKRPAKIQVPTAFT